MTYFDRMLQSEFASYHRKNASKRSAMFILIKLAIDIAQLCVQFISLVVQLNDFCYERGICCF